MDTNRRQPFPLDLVCKIGRAFHDRTGLSAVVGHLKRSTMKLVWILALGLLLFEPRAVAGLDTDIARTNRVILSSGRWNPSAVETQKALAAIQKFLDRPTTTNEWARGEIRKILEHTKEYRVQFVGVVRDRKRLIWCNFFNTSDDFGKGWKEEKIEVMDGGFWYWQIEYDPAAGECLHFRSNGYA
jgi:hypothetical protein